MHQSGAEPGQPSTRIFHTVSTRRRHTTTQTLISAPARFLIKDTSHPPQIQMDVDGYWLWMDYGANCKPRTEDRWWLGAAALARVSSSLHLL